MHYWHNTSSNIFNETLQFNIQIYVVGRNGIGQETGKHEKQYPNNKSLQTENNPSVGKCTLKLQI